MHVTITINGQEYELQITARKVINGGRTSLSMDDAETSALLNGIAEELRSILCAVDYASEQREYEASYESDEESRREMEESAKEWSDLRDRLQALLDNEC